MWTLLAVLLLAISHIHGQSVVTNGTSGQPCPHRRCLAGRADCIDGTCECRPPFVLRPKNGHFACYRPNNVDAEVKNDPTVTNFNQETANFPYPCRYLVTSTQTALRIRKERVGSCRCIMHAWNNKYRGKFYAGGFDFTCRINNTARNEELEFAISIAGRAENGLYTYREQGSNVFSPDGPWTGPPVDVTGAGVTVKSSYDSVNNQARVVIPECGWVITFVAYDIKERQNQSQIPGLALAINCGLNPVFYEHDRVIATAPERFGGTKYSDLVEYPLTIPEMLVLRGFQSLVSQNHPGGTPECPAVSNVLNECSEENKVKAATGCFWMLKRPLFIRCMNSEDNVDSLLGLLQTCINHHCGRERCQTFVNSVVDSGCSTVPRVPELTYILRDTYCYP